MKERIIPTNERTNERIATMNERKNEKKIASRKKERITRTKERNNSNNGRTIEWNENCVLKESKTIPTKERMAPMNKRKITFGSIFFEETVFFSFFAYDPIEYE